MIFPYLSPWVPACKSSLSCPTSESLRHHGCQELVTEASYQHSKLRTPQRKLRNIAILSISCENFDQDEHNIRNEQNEMTSSGSFSPVFIRFSIFWIMWLDKNSIVPNCTFWKVDPVGVSGFQVSKSAHLTQSSCASRKALPPSFTAWPFDSNLSRKQDRKNEKYVQSKIMHKKQANISYQLVITHPILKPYFEICILPYLVYNSLSMSYHNAKHTVQSYTAKSSNICEYFNQARTTHLKPWHRLSVSPSDVALQCGLDLLAVIHLRFTRLVTWKDNK